MLPVKIRGLVEEDLNCILSNWLNHYKKHSPFARRIKNSVFYKNHHNVILNIMKRTESRCLIATPEDDDELIIGYIVYETLSENVVHFLFVKEPFRRIGIAKKLLAEAKILNDDFAFTHFTYGISEIIRKYSKLTYNPYYLNGEIKNDATKT